MTEIAKVLENSTNKPSSSDKKSIDALVSDIRKAINAKELANLETQLRQQVDSDVVEKILSNWSYIGGDIKFNHALLGEKRKQYVLQKAIEIQEAKNKGQKVDALLDNLEKALKTDLPASEIVIKQKYQDLDMLLQGVAPEKKQRYQLILNKALLNKQIRNPRAFCGSPLKKWC